MDKFLELAFRNHVNGDTDFPYEIDRCFSPLIQRLKSLLSEEIFEELQEMLVDEYTDAMYIAGVAGMELAIGVLNGNINQVLV